MCDLQDVLKKDLKMFRMEKAPLTAELHSLEKIKESQIKQWMSGACNRRSYDHDGDIYGIIALNSHKDHVYRYELMNESISQSVMQIHKQCTV